MLLLRVDDQLAYSRDDAQKAALEASASARAATDRLWACADALRGAKPKDVKALVEANGYRTMKGLKPLTGDELRMLAADGLAFGALPACELCGGRELRHCGEGQGAHAVTFCHGYVGQTPCTLDRAGFAPERGPAWAVPAELRKGKSNPLAALGEASDAARGEAAPAAPPVAQMGIEEAFERGVITASEYHRHLLDGTTTVAAPSR